MRVSTIDRLDDPKDDQGDVRKTKFVRMPDSYITSRYMVARTDGGLIYDVYLSPDALQVTLHNRESDSNEIFSRSGGIHE